jgi:hypothetical protein
MSIRDPELLFLLRAAVFTVFAGVGGLLAYLLRCLNSGEKAHFGRAMIEMLSSGFFGAVMILACMSFKVDIYLAGALAGVFGWLGAEASMLFIKKLINKRFGIKSDEK